MILPLPLDNALICFLPGTQVIIISENLIKSSNEFVAFPFLDLNFFKDLALISRSMHLFCGLVSDNHWTQAQHQPIILSSINP